VAAIHSVNTLKNLLLQQSGFTPVIATEIEFYLHGASERFTKDVAVALVRDVALNAGLPLARADAEVGLEQFEVSFLPSLDIDCVIQQTEQFKTVLREVCEPKGITTDFSAKPLADQPGSGLHVHFHLQDTGGRNVFTRAGDEMDAAFSNPLRYCISGMLTLMNPCMVFFAPKQASYARFVAKSNAPLTVSWGTNNRTVALRLPSKALDNKHIEHRVAGSDAAIADAVWAVLAGACYGLEQRMEPPEPIYGDAALPQYNQVALAKSLDEAKQHHQNCKELLQYL